MAMICVWQNRNKQIESRYVINADYSADYIIQQIKFSDLIKLIIQDFRDRGRGSGSEREIGVERKRNGETAVGTDSERERGGGENSRESMINWFSYGRMS